MATRSDDHTSKQKEKLSTAKRGESRDVDGDTKTLYDMKIGDIVTVSQGSGRNMVRVPGGWVYEYGGVGMVACCFVPESK